jgi:hypothetical protein
MARTLPTTLSAGLAAAVTAPGYLIALGTSPVLRYSTRGTLTYGGYTWVGGARVEGLALAAGGAPPRLVLPNADNALSALLLGGVLSDVSAEIWAIYGDAPSEAESVFVGVVDGAYEIGLLACVLALADDSAGASSLPRAWIGAPIFNHLPPPGSVITWGGTTYTLEASDG